MCFTPRVVCKLVYSQVFFFTTWQKTAKCDGISMISISIEPAIKSRFIEQAAADVSMHSPLRHWLRAGLRESARTMAENLTILE